MQKWSESFLYFFFYCNTTFPVTCGSNSDCSKIPERNVCKEDKNGEATCQAVAACSCTGQEICNVEEKCEKPGNRNVQ